MAKRPTNTTTYETPGDGMEPDVPGGAGGMGGMGGSGGMDDGGNFDPPDDIGGGESSEDQPDDEQGPGGGGRSRGGDAGAQAALRGAKQAIEAHLSAAASNSKERFEFSAQGDTSDAIVGVGEGYGITTGGMHESMAAEGAPGLVIFVKHPMSEEDLRRSGVDVLGARALSSDRLPVHIVVTGEIDAYSHRAKHRPAPCGVSVAHSRVTAGTLGCLATGRSAPRNGRTLILSNNHVLANSNAAAINDNILQPGPADGGVNPRDRIAILERWVPIAFGGAPNFVDCATGWAWRDRVRKEFVHFPRGVATYFRCTPSLIEPRVGLRVGKSGRTTALTNGTITATAVTINVNYGGGRVANFRDQFAVQTPGGLFSAGGDSGSLVWTADARRCPVGLLFAGGGGVTFCNRIRRVVDALDINFVM